MKKFLLILPLLLVLLAFPVKANSPGELVYDQADLLTPQEETQLIEKLEALEGDVTVLTLESLEGYPASTYADDYYDAYFGDDGMLLLISMEERQWYISTAGEYVALVDVDAFSENFLPAMGEGDYYTAFCRYADAAKALTELSGMWILIAIGAGVLIATCVMLVMRGKMKTVRAQNSAASYMLSGSLVLRSNQDIFLYHTTTRTAKPQNTSRSTHTGSSGRSHGGGGGRF